MLRELEPALRLGWSVPRVRKRDYTRSLAATPSPAYALLLYVRRRLPRVAAGHIAAGRCDAVMATASSSRPALLEAVRDAGGELYVWTVDDARRIRALEALGVTGVITNDPRLFDGSADRAGGGRVALAGRRPPWSGGPASVISTARRDDRARRAASGSGRRRGT